MVRHLGYNDYMAYHYAYMMNVTSVREPETLSEAKKDPRWIAVIDMGSHPSHAAQESDWLSMDLQSET